MKLWQFVGALATVVFTAVGFTPQSLGQDARGFVVAVGDPVPAFELTDVDGQTYSNTSLLGTTYVLQFTASWCSVCRAEMPHLEREVWQRFSSRERGFMLLGVDYDEGADNVRAFAQQMGVTYPMCPDPEGRVFQTVAAPKAGVTRNVVVDEQGTVVMLTRLFDEEEFARMVERVDALTGQQ